MAKALLDAPLWPLILLVLGRAIWMAPAWGHRLLDFLRDLDSYRRERGSR